MMRTGRGAADRGRQDAPRAATVRDRIHTRFEPDHGNGLAVAILLSLLLWGLLIVTALHLIARFA
jgi:hypothetical protein